MKHLIEFRFGDTHSRFVYGGADAVSLIEAYRIVFEYIRKHNIFPGLYDFEVSEKTIKQIKDGNINVDKEGAIKAIEEARDLWLEIRTAYRTTDIRENEELYLLIKKFLGIMSMRYGLFLGGGELPRGFVVTEHGLIENEREI